MHNPFGKEQETHLVNVREDPPQEQLLNKSMIEMFTLVGRKKGKDVLGLIMNCYLESVDSMLENLMSAVQTQDFAHIESYAHSLKSSSAQVGAVYLSILYESIERAAMTSTLPPDTEEFFKHLDKTQARVVKTIQKLLDRRDPENAKEP